MIAMLSELRFEKVLEAAKIYRLLLSRRFPRDVSLNIVCNRYSLSKVERMVLYRCVHPKHEAEERKRKTVNAEDIKGSRLIIDGFNVAITTSTALKGIPVFEGDDGFIRDVRKSMKIGKPHYSELVPTISLILLEARKLEPAEAIVFYDEQISWSGLLASFTRKIIKRIFPSGDAFTASRSDTAVIEIGGIACTSDVVILNSVSSVFDLSKHVISIYRPESILSVAN